MWSAPRPQIWILWGFCRSQDKMGLALDLANVRLMLEPGIAEMAALNATEEDIQKLRELCDVVEHKILAGESYIQEDIVFPTPLCGGVCEK